ncbi:signal peptidase I [Pseudomonadota bacterium]
MINFLYTIGAIGGWLLTSVLTLSFFVVEGGSMEPSLQDGELFLIDGYTYQISEPKRQDVVVFSFENDPDYFYVKRIIGLPEEKVHIKQDGIYVEEQSGDLRRIEEQYLKNNGEDTSNYLRKKNLDEIFAVPEGKYFVLGDNRQDSLDSRSFKQPFISFQEIHGRLIYTFEEEPIMVIKDKEIRFDVEVASTPEERKVGLMFREEMPEERGMLFIFESEMPLSFWMKNTLIPLDMIFIDKDYRVVNIQKDARPCEKDPCKTYSSEGNAKYVLEINSGLSNELGIEEGDKFILMNQ